ncbi:MAG: uroporphyrinogen-III C-methyltransferase, partial [Candidatus Dormibacteraeota bacterium]|nr:uroporphyrinogen-III C-methyltransferase [Candidatus Dormibacteraeota bacterium]
ERLFGDEWGPFTQVVGTVRRRLRRRGVGPDQQRRAYKRLLQSPVRRLLRDGRYTEAADLAAAVEHAAGTRAGTPAGEVILVGAGPGDPGLITVAGREALGYADVVFHDALVDRGVLELAASDARLVNVGKRAGRPSMPQDEINALLIAAARDGQLVVRLKGGDPLLFARGGEEIGALLAAGIAVRVVPGVSSALAAPGAAGIPLTHRGVAASVAITTGRQAAAGPDRLADLAASADTLVVLMPAKLDDITRRIAAVVGADRPAALVSAATLPGQRVIVAPVGEIAEAIRARSDAELRMEAPRTLVVGDVVRVAFAAGAAEPAAEDYSLESFQP